ncbi:MAG: hypothetical protein AAF560_22340 [Acidobacteriota bacterium]
MEFSTKDEYIAFLEARVASLESALERRSRIHRMIQREVSSDDLLVISRIEAGLPPLPDQAYDVELWPETTDLTAADVEQTMTDLWRSLQPFEEPEA